MIFMSPFIHCQETALGKFRDHLEIYEWEEYVRSIDKLRSIVGEKPGREGTETTQGGSREANMKDRSRHDLEQICM